MLDGTAHAPGQPWNHGNQTIRTLWGELAWQLGEAEGFALVQRGRCKRHLAGEGRALHAADPVSRRAWCCWTNWSSTSASSWKASR